jgi:DNA invertase Pin-like site-specific DNA recombinase
VGWFDPKPTAEKKAVAYYRHSAQDKQEYSVEIQQEHVRKFAADHGVEIVKEFADRGVTGVVVDDRDAFNEMMRDYIHGPKREGLDYVLVYDVSRWGRFQKDDEAAHYSYECSSRGIGVVFSTMGFPKENDLFYNVYLNFERWRAAKYSQELSVKVWKGCSKIASYGYWAGGMPPYGMRRLLIDEQKKPVRVMERGEHKAIHNQRTILVPGSDSEVETIREIFKSFVNKHRQPEEIAAMLNDRQIPSPGKSTWTRSSVCAILTNEIYAGTMVWNKTDRRSLHPDRVPADIQRGPAASASGGRKVAAPALRCRYVVQTHGLVQAVWNNQQRADIRQ